MIDQSDTRHLHITFFLEPIENPTKSRAEGRPIFEEREMVEIKFVGDPKKILVAPAHEKFARDHASGQWVSYAQAYHRHYEAFKTGEAAKGEGTPIEELPFISAARRAELRALHIHTAEALSGLEGASLARLGMFGRELKDKAQAYIEKAKDSALETRLAAENTILRQRIEALEARMQSEATVPDEASPQPAPGFAAWADADLKHYIKERSGETPRGRYSRESLVALAEKIAGQAVVEAA
jgi:hypothetical protein